MNEAINLNDIENRDIGAKNEPDHTPGLTPDVLFIEDVARVLRTSRSTIERRRRAGSFPIPELPGIDGRPRWSRQALDRYLTSTTNGMSPRRRRPGRQR